MKKSIYRKPVVKTIHVENHICSGSNLGNQEDYGSGAAKESTFMFDDIEE